MWELKVTLSNNMELIKWVDEASHGDNVMHNWRVAFEGQVMVWRRGGILIKVPYHAVAFWSTEMREP